MVNNEIRDIFEALKAEKGIGLADAAVISGFSRYVVTRYGDVFYLRGKNQNLAQARATNRKYPTVNLVDDSGVRRSLSLARLVAGIYCGERPSDSHRVYHRDGDTRNNVADNLYWSDQSPRKEYLRRMNMNETLSYAVLSERDVRNIYDQLLENQTLRSIASDYAVSPQTIQLIKDGVTWNHVISDEDWMFLNGFSCSGLRDDIVAYIAKRTGDKDVRKLPDWVIDENERTLYLTESGHVFDVKSVSVDQVEKFSRLLNSNCVQINWLHAKKAIYIAGRPYRVPYLVAATYHGKPQFENRKYLKFKDGDSTNCHRDNVMWSTTRVGGFGASDQKMNPDTVAMIKLALEEGLNVRDVAEKFDVSRNTVYNIRSGRAWRWVDTNFVMGADAEQPEAVVLSS